MMFEEFYKRFQLNDDIVKTTGFNPYYHRLQSGLNDTLTIDGEDYIDLASNNYLGIANSERIKEAVIRATEKYGVSLCATPIASGYSDLYEKVSEQLSEFIGLESTLIYPSCYQANNGLFSVIAGKDDVIIIDQYAHSSLVQGAKIVGCKLRPFLHNNMDSLERNLKNSIDHRQILVVTESVFSTEGGIAPLKSINELCEKYNALPIVDDSHGIGVIGGNGSGILEYEGITDYQGVYTASLGKSIGNLGGIVSGKKNIIEYIQYHSPHLIYSTALPPLILAGIEEVINIIRDEFDTLSAVMWKNYNALRHALIESGYNLTNAKAPINSIITGEPEDTFLFARKLYENKILTTPFIYPSVPRSKGVIRLIAGANLKDSTMNEAIEIFRKIQ